MRERGERVGPPASVEKGAWGGTPRAFWLCQLASGFELACRAICELARVEIDLDLAAVQVAADQFFRQRILDVALDGAPQRPRAVRSILARHLDDPVDHLGRQRDLQLAIGEVV